MQYADGPGNTCGGARTHDHIVRFSSLAGCDMSAACISWPSCFSSPGSSESTIIQHDLQTPRVAVPFAGRMVLLQQPVVV